jgi:hypothetical protein
MALALANYSSPPVGSMKFLPQRMNNAEVHKQGCSTEK